MNREALEGFLRIGVFIAGAGICSALMLPRDSGEFVVSVCSSMIGLLLIAGVVVAFRMAK